MPGIRSRGLHSPLEETLGYGTLSFTEQCVCLIRLSPGAVYLVFVIAGCGLTLQALSKYLQDSFLWKIVCSASTLQSVIAPASRLRHMGVIFVMC